MPLRAASALGGGVVCTYIATRVSAPSVMVSFGAALGLGLVVWTFLSERIEGPLAVFLLYLGLLDGFVKLKTNSSVITLGRDGLLYAIAAGWLARAALRRQTLRLPPLSGWVLAFVAVALVQLANPNDTGLVHSLGALRPHLEFVPLFFIGYGTLRTVKRLRIFFVLLAVIAAANGVVSVVQLELSPNQLATWGPGYAQRINGTGAGVTQVSGRVFFTNGHQARTRPFGLGDDAGVGGVWGMLAVGAAVALLSLGPRSRGWRAVAILSVGVPLTVISSEGRSVLIGSVIALLVYVCFATTARRLIPTLAAVILGLAAIIVVAAFISSVGGLGVFDRYATVTPGKLAATTSHARGTSISEIPKLIQAHPLGNGIGFVGPAAKFAGGGGVGSNGETEPGYLVSELGIPGLLVFYGLNLHLLLLGMTRIRRGRDEVRPYIAALLAGLVALLITGISASTSATSPNSPYFWLTAGILSYWLTGARVHRGVSQMFLDGERLSIPDVSLATRS